jgi:hypothetical protein
MRGHHHGVIAVLGSLGMVVVLLVAALGTLGAGVPTLLATSLSGGPRLGVAKIGQIAAQAGFSGEGLAIAIAVALAESGGDPLATDHDRDGTVDRGLWQINSVHTAYSAACDYAPFCAAGAAYQISNGGRDWSPWVTYQRGEEIAYLPAAISFVDAHGATT